MQSKVSFDMKKFLKSEETRRILVLGATGSGKTVFANNLSLNLLQYRHMPVIVIDAKREEKFRRLRSLSAAFVNNRRQWKVKLQSLKQNGVEINDYRVPEFGAACVWEMQKSCLYVEEMVEYYDKNSVTFPQHYPLTYKVLQQGREKGIWFIGSTQMVSQLNLSFIKQASDVFLFAVRNVEARQLEKSMGVDEGTFKFSAEKKFDFYHIPQSHEDPIHYPAIRMKKADDPETEEVENSEFWDEYEFEE